MMCASFYSSFILILMLSKPEEKEEEMENETTEEEDLTEDDLPRIKTEVSDLQAQFDAAVDEKHSLEMELTSMKERLKAATEMIARLVSLGPPPGCMPKSIFLMVAWV